jgi:L-glutamine-phosphate cytidylyltransferase
MAGAPERPPDPFATPARAAGASRPAQPARLPRMGVVLAAGRSERLERLTQGASKALLRLGGLRLVERAVRTLLACGLERVVVVVGHDAGPVAAVVGRLAPGRVRAVLADRWRDGNGASLAAVEGAVASEALFALLTADHGSSRARPAAATTARGGPRRAGAGRAPRWWARNRYGSSTVKVRSP